jgi:formate hydrogenlyase subunit 6/NADH:ubiquinone oxidoreductase subunit I
VEAILQDHDDSIYVCIHCGQCVDFCPHDCLEMRDPETVALGEVTV